MTEDEMVGWHHQLNAHVFEQTLGEVKVQKAQGPGVCKLPKPPASRPLCQAKRAPRALAPHERLPEILVVPREKTPTGAAARGNP